MDELQHSELKLELGDGEFCIATIVQNCESTSLSSVLAASIRFYLAMARPRAIGCFSNYKVTMWNVLAGWFRTSLSQNNDEVERCGSVEEDSVEPMPRQGEAKSKCPSTTRLNLSLGIDIDFVFNQALT